MLFSFFHSITSSPLIIIFLIFFLFPHCKTGSERFVIWRGTYHIQSKIYPCITVSPFYGYGIPPGKSLDGDSDSPYPPCTDIKDICRLSIKDNRSTLYNRKGQPVKKCNRTSKMSYLKGRRTMAPKKKEKNLKRSNIITLKLTDIELAVLNEAADCFIRNIQSFSQILLSHSIDFS